MRIKTITGGLFMLAASLVTGCGGDSGSSGTAPDPERQDVQPFEAIHHEVIDLPEDVRPLYSSWSPDGERIVFGNIVDGAIWMVDADGANPHCVTCDMPDLPAIHSAFSYIFPDQKRLFVSNELGDRVFVVECEPSVVQCDDHTVLPVDLSEDLVDDPRKQNVGRRTYHLAPDGKHLGYTMTRPDTMVMLIGELQRQADKYVVADPKVINPPGPSGPDDDNVQGWKHAAQMYELKSFADGGRSALVVGETSLANPDTLKIDLQTGSITRMASSSDWDEDGAVSPDGDHFVVASWRGMERLEAFGAMPLAKGFFDFPLFAVIAFYHVSHFTGFQCDLQPWLLSGSGDQHGKLTGQPLLPYKGGDVLAANNLAGHPFWSPDSTRILLREHLTTVPEPDANEELKVKGIPPNRLLIARLDREPTEQQPVVETRVGDWASTPEKYTGAFATSKTVFIRGSHGGTIEVVYSGTLAGADYLATYTDYSEDGELFLSGTTALVGSVYNRIDFSVDLTALDADGQQVGRQVGEVAFEHFPATPYDEAPWVKTGGIETTFRGYTAPPLAEAGPCLDSLPRPAPLSVEYQENNDALTVTVTATILGDERPVRRALVSVAGQTGKTDRQGEVTLPWSGEAPFTIQASAGDTFQPAELEVSE